MYISLLLTLLSRLILLIEVFLTAYLVAGGLPAWFRHVYFESHAHVGLRLKLACGSGEPWTRDADIPQGCPLSMIFTVALYLPCVTIYMLSMVSNLNYMRIIFDVAHKTRAAFERGISDL